MLTQQVFSSIRPQRIAFLIPSDETNWMQSCLHILDYCTKVWGGYNSIIVPTDGKSIDPLFWQLLESFEPDHIKLYRRSGRDISLDDPTAFESTLKSHIVSWEKQIGEPAQQFQIDAIREDLYKSYPQVFSISGELNSELRNRLAPFFYKELVVTTVTSGSTPAYPLTETKSILSCLRKRMNDTTVLQLDRLEESLWAGSQIGYADPNTVADLSSWGLNVTQRNPQGADLFGLVLSDIPGFEGRPSISTIADVTLAGLGQYCDLRHANWQMPSLAVVGDTLDDYCLYQTLSRLRERVVWLPPWLERETPQSTSLPDSFFFLSLLKQLTEFSNIFMPGVKVISKSHSREKIEKIIERLAKVAMTEINWSVGDGEDQSVLYPLRLYEANNAFMPQLENVTADGAIELFSGRKPKSLINIPPQKVRWISELSFQGQQIPRHPSIGRWMTGATTREARSTRNALAFINVGAFVGGTDDAEEASIKPTIRMPYPRELFRVVARWADLEETISDKGIYSQVMIDKFGGLSGTAKFLKTELGLGLVQIYQDNKDARFGVFLNDERRRYLDYNAVRLACSDDNEAKSAIDFFCKNKIFYRGFIFRCEYCRRASWYSVGEIDDEFTCKRCHRKQVYVSFHWKEPEQPLWYYQLDEVIYQAIISDCHIPILALGKLMANSKNQFTQTVELRYQEIADGSNPIESDINCIVNGYLTIGEAKKRNRLASSAQEERAVAVRYRDLAKRLSASQVVFATLEEEWRPATVEIISQVFSLSNQRLLFLTSNDLLKD
jgi:hypothetical protein